jgi:hypothetical protein
MKRVLALAISLLSFVLASSGCGVEGMESSPSPASSGGSSGGSPSGGAASSAGGATGSGGTPGGVTGSGGAASPAQGNGGAGVGAGGAMTGTGSGGAGAAGGNRADAAMPSVPADAAPRTDGPSTPPASGMDPIASGAPAGKITVFLHLGHSNMAGRATGPADLRPMFYDVHPQLWSYHWMNMVTGKGMPFQWRPGKEPMSPDDMTGTKAGPGMALLKTALARSGPGQYFVSIGHGHSGTEGGHCRNYRKTGLLYNIVMGPALALKGKVTFGGIFVMLGTTERYFDLTVQKGFGDCLKGLAEDIRGDLGDVNIPFLVSDWEGRSGDKDPNGPVGKIIIPQLKAAPEAIMRAGFIPQDATYTYADMNHYDMASYKKWAEAGLDLMIQKGWAPWAK